MSCDHTKTCSCGCCEGLGNPTPESTRNEAGQAVLRYRVGKHGTFKQSMLLGLAGKPGLHYLTTRSDNDPTVALVDAWSVVLDVLTFYQERIIQEGYLRTSTERLSLVELARHISYRPKPGVAAGAWLSFYMDESPGAPLSANIPTGTKVQSIPGQDEKPQLFETIGELAAKTGWNNIRPQLAIAQTLPKGCTQLYLKGTGALLQKGDVIVIVGEQRFSDPGSERWDMRTVHSVAVDSEANRTLVTWREGLGHENPLISPGTNAKVYVFRQRAALFGYNAPDPGIFSSDVRTALGVTTSNNTFTWNNFFIVNPSNKIIYLDAEYPRVLKNSWLALVRPDYSELYRITNIASSSRTAFSLSSKSSMVTLDTSENLAGFGLRETLVLAQSEALELDETPVYTAFFGKKITLDESRTDLYTGQKLLVTGERVQWLQVTSRETILRKGKDEYTQKENRYFKNGAGVSKLLGSGEILEVTGTPEMISPGLVRWQVKRAGETGTVDSDPDDLLPWTPPEDSAKPKVASSLNAPIMMSELVEISKVISGDVIEFKVPLEHCYIRHTVKINANVAEATHGETRVEILGSGNGSAVFQKFKLKQKPLTYVSAATDSGTESTLQIRVNDILWKEADTFYGKGPNERIYVVSTEDDGTVYVQFGNGITGARLMTGQDNIRATYRVGIGLEGLLDAKQLSMLLSPQLGVKSVLNPLPSTGAEDPEAPENIRSNAPQTVLGLDRIVSILDYQFFANAFAGIGKARADLLWKGESRILHLTVASATGGKVDKDLKDKLASAIDNARHDLYPVIIQSFKQLYFNLEASVKIHPDYLAEIVFEQIRTALLKEYSFENRNFGQNVSPSEVIALIQEVEGVIAVDLDVLGNKNPFGLPFFILPANAAVWSGNSIAPAQLLIIDPDNITLKEWSNEN